MSTAISAAPSVRPSGGYVLISVNDICRAWTAYRSRAIKLVNLRAWFACHEMAARRCTLKKGREPQYSLDELHRLVGGAGGGHVRKAVRRSRRQASSPGPLTVWSSKSQVRSPKRLRR